jgi:hypothetical protein
MGLSLRSIDNITELRSEVLYIKRYVGRFTIDNDSELLVFYAYFSIENVPIGAPRVEIKHIDDPIPALVEAEGYLKDMIRDLAKNGKIKHSPFTCL